MCLRWTVFNGEEKGTWGPLLIWARHFREGLWEVKGGMARECSRRRQAWRGPRDKHSPSRHYLCVVSPTQKESDRGAQ